MNNDLVDKEVAYIALSRLSEKAVLKVRLVECKTVSGFIKVIERLKTLELVPEDSAKNINDDSSFFAAIDELSSKLDSVMTQEEHRYYHAYKNDVDGGKKLLVWAALESRVISLDPSGKLQFNFNSGKRARVCRNPEVPSSGIKLDRRGLGGHFEYALSMFSRVSSVRSTTVSHTIEDDLHENKPRP